MKAKLKELDRWAIGLGIVFILFGLHGVFRPKPMILDHPKIPTGRESNFDGDERLSARQARIYGAMIAGFGALVASVAMVRTGK
jgi:hypothetical protein